MTQNGINFNSVKTAGVNYDQWPLILTGQQGPDSDGGIINAVDIDWNGAEIYINKDSQENTIINQTGLLISIIQDSYDYTKLKNTPPAVTKLSIQALGFIDSVPEITVTTTGSGNVVTDITTNGASGITITKGTIQQLSSQIAWENITNRPEILDTTDVTTIASSYLSQNGIKKILLNGNEVASNNGVVNLNVVTDKSDKADKTNTISNIVISLVTSPTTNDPANTSPYSLKVETTKADSTSNTYYIDLPLELLVTASYNELEQKVVFQPLGNGNSIEIPVVDIVGGLLREIDADNKLNSDLVDDTNQTHKFVTADEKSAWNNKVSSVKTLNGESISGTGKLQYTLAAGTDSKNGIIYLNLNNSPVGSAQISTANSTNNGLLTSANYTKLQNILYNNLANNDVSILKFLNTLVVEKYGEDPTRATVGEKSIADILSTYYVSSYRPLQKIIYTSYSLSKINMTGTSNNFYSRTIEIEIINIRNNYIDIKVTGYNLSANQYGINAGLVGSNLSNAIIPDTCVGTYDINTATFVNNSTKKLSNISGATLNGTVIYPDQYGNINITDNNSSRLDTVEAKLNKIGTDTLFKNYGYEWSAQGSKTLMYRIRRIGTDEQFNTFAPNNTLITKVNNLETELDGKLSQSDISFTNGEMSITADGANVDDSSNVRPEVDITDEPGTSSDPGTSTDPGTSSEPTTEP